ncbi:MAG: hypothetical protein CSB48_06860 [Proteobacteria bacterium]|nr:MAG: hypothetical protein CSB48_06860 [Pseudomonadota bacterium]
MAKLPDFLLATFFIALLCWLGYSFWQAYQPLPVHLQGQIEARSYSISSKVAGRISELYVRKGDAVKKGQPVFSLYSPELEARIEQAKAGEQAAGALVEEAEAGARRQQIDVAKEQWRKADAVAKLAEKSYRRVENLYRDGVVAEQKRDEAYTAWQAARHTATAALQMYKMTEEGSRSETKKAAREREKMAAGAVAEVEAIAADLQISSLYDGQVSQVLLYPGELAPQGFPVVRVIDMKDSWVVMHIREDSLQQWKKGYEFDGRIPALGNRVVRFRVFSIAVMGDYATWRATDIRKDFDMRTFAVEARPIEPVADLRAGMSVLVP